MPSDIKECSLYSFTLRGQKVKTTPKDITARAAAEAAQITANGKQDALTAAQLAAVNSGVTAEKVATYDAFVESDPTVPAWAKQATKPTYTASEVGALPDTTVIPAASSASPQMDGTATEGNSDDYARADHVHPSDNSKQDAIQIVSGTFGATTGYTYVDYPDGFTQSNSFVVALNIKRNGHWRGGEGMISGNAQNFVDLGASQIGVYNSSSAGNNADFRIALIKTS